MRAWIGKLRGLSPQSRHNYRGRLANLFGYAVKNNYVDSNPVKGIELERLVGAPPEIFRPDQLRMLLENANSDVVPLLAIGAFAGLRSAELLRLEWKDLERGSVRVEAAKAKSARRRVIKMSPNLAAWLAPYQGREGRLWTRSENEYHWTACQAMRLAGLSKWPHNGLRHSFASYHLAQQDAPRLALDMGHVSPHLIFAHYREIVSEEEAERYWTIFPPVPAVPAANVVRIAQAC